MKKLLLLILIASILGLFFQGCDQSENPVMPEEQTEMLKHGKGLDEKGGGKNALFTWTEIYRDGVGPACFYGQDVRIVFDDATSWKYKIKNGNLKQKLVRRGTTYIRDMSGNLIDTRRFKIEEIIVDKNLDVATRVEDPQGTYYSAIDNWTDASLEYFKFTIRIPGVYFWKYENNRKGEILRFWKSGDCVFSDPPIGDDDDGDDDD